MNKTETEVAPREGAGGIDTDEQSGLRIVVATASPEIGDLLAIVLGDAGYAVERATSPEGAAALVRAHPTALLLTDLFARPGEDPLGVVCALRDAVAPCPVGLTTAWSLDAAAVTRAGFAVLIRQPFDLEELLLCVAVAIARPLDAAHARQVDVVRRYFAALTARDWDALVDLCTEDIVYVLPGPAPFATTLHGTAAFRAYTAETFGHFPAARFGGVRAHATPQGIAAEYRATWLAPSGEEVGQDGVVLFAFEGERIAQVQRVGQGVEVLLHQHRRQDGHGGREQGRVEREAERGRCVEQEGVVATGSRQELAQAQRAGRIVGQGVRGRLDAPIAGVEVDAGEDRVRESVEAALGRQDALADPLDGRGLLAQDEARQGRLRIEVDEEHARPALGQHAGEIQRRRRLAGSPLRPAMAMICAMVLPHSSLLAKAAGQLGEDISCRRPRSNSLNGVEIISNLWRLSQQR